MRVLTVGILPVVNVGIRATLVVTSLNKLLRMVFIIVNLKECTVDKCYFESTEQFRY